MTQQQLMNLTREIRERLDTYTWIVRKEKSWNGADGFVISIKEIEDCVSYGETFQEARNGLEEAVLLWLKKRSKGNLPESLTHNGLVVIEQTMSHEEFERINYYVKEWH